MTNLRDEQRKYLDEAFEANEKAFWDAYIQFGADPNKVFKWFHDAGFDIAEQSPIFKQMLKIITNLAECEGAVTEDAQAAKKLLKELG